MKMMHWKPICKMITGAIQEESSLVLKVKLLILLYSSYIQAFILLSQNARFNHIMLLISCMNYAAPLVSSVHFL